MKKTRQNVKVIPCYAKDEWIARAWTKYFIGDAAKQRAAATGKEPVVVWVVIDGREYSGYAV